MTIPKDINEAELQLALETGYLSSNLTIGEKCSFTEHPRFGNQKYCHMWLYNKLHVAYKCIFMPFYIIRFQSCWERKNHSACNYLTQMPNEASNIHPCRFKALVIFQEPHNHPMHRYKKATPYRLELLRQLNEAASLAPITARQLMQGMRWDVIMTRIY